MLPSLSLGLLILIFCIASFVVWIAGIQLSKTTDALDNYFKIGDALGGMIFLAIATNLPEIAIVSAACLTSHFDVAIGNILGGIAIQTVILVLLDRWGLKQKAALTYAASSLVLVMEGVLVICVLVIAIMGTQLPSNIIYFHVAPADLLILFTWLLGLYVINKARKNLPWFLKDKTKLPALNKNTKKDNSQKRNITLTIVIFTLASLATLIAGIFLEESGNYIAKDIGLSGVIFASTILAASTALPEISTGLAAIQLGDYELAFSDIYGGNAFLVVLFLLGSLLSGKAILSHAQKTDIYLANLGILLTSIYIFGLIFRLNRQYFWLGIDSIVVLLAYIFGLLGLFVIG